MSQYLGRISLGFGYLKMGSGAQRGAASPRPSRRITRISRYRVLSNSCIVNAQETPEPLARERSHTVFKSPRSNEEIHMYAKATVTRARLLGGATTVACTLFAGDLAAKDKIVTVSVHVSDQGLDLTQPGDAQTFYTRLENAAWVACTRGNRADLHPSTTLKGFYEKALGAAIRSAKARTLTHPDLLANLCASGSCSARDRVPAQIAVK